jgi:hypothetical protein
MVFAIPMLDAMLSIMRRTLRGKPVFSADRDHIHHRLLMRGMTHRQAVLALYSVSCITALLTLLLLYNARATAYVLIMFCVVIVVVVATLDYEDLRELRAAIRRTWMHRSILSSNIEFRRTLQSIDFIGDRDLALQEINRHLAPDSYMQFVLGDYEPDSHCKRCRWSLLIPVRDASGERIATLLLFSDAAGVPFEISLLESCGAILARAAHPQPSFVKAMAAGQI